MAIPSELITALCSHCERDIPTSNIDLHYAHCSRNLQKCAICGEMIPKKQADEHYNEIHAPVDCSLCSETIERELWSLHKGERCPQRIVTCEYCEFPLPAVDLLKHQEICGNRTEYCEICHKYVRLRERIQHDIQLHSNQGSTEEPLREIRAPERQQHERQHVNRRQERGAAPHRRILLTIAITGVAVAVGSFFLQKKVEYQQ